MTFYGRSKRIWNPITGTDNASFIFGADATGGTVEFVAGRTTSITTAGGDVTFLTYARSPGTGNITTHGGNVNFTPATTAVTAFRGGAANFSVVTEGGNINVAGHIDPLGGGSAANTITLNAGTGNISFSNKANTPLSLTATANSITFNGDWGDTTSLGALSLTSTNGLTLPSITATSITAQTTGATADITIPTGKTLTASGAGNALTIASGGNFINNAGASALSTPAGRWLVYSDTPTLDTPGGLSPVFTQYSCTYGSCTLSNTSNNGFLYRQALAGGGGAPAVAAIPEPSPESAPVNVIPTPDPVPPPSLTPTVETTPEEPLPALAMELPNTYVLPAASHDGENTSGNQTSFDNGAPTPGLDVSSTNNIDARHGEAARSGSNSAQDQAVNGSYSYTPEMLLLLGCADGSNDNSTACGAGR